MAGWMRDTDRIKTDDDATTNFSSAGSLRSSRCQGPEVWARGIYVMPPNPRGDVCPGHHHLLVPEIGEPGSTESAASSRTIWGSSYDLYVHTYRRRTNQGSTIILNSAIGVLGMYHAETLRLLPRFQLPTTTSEP